MATMFQVEAPGAMTASRAAAWLMLGLCAQQCAAQLPGLPLPAQCVGAAEGPAPRSDLNWPANETKLAQAMRQVDQGKVQTLGQTTITHACVYHLHLLLRLWRLAAETLSLSMSGVRMPSPRQ